MHRRPAAQAGAAAGAGDGVAAPPIRVLFVLLPGSLALDWAGPAEALRVANQVLRAQGRDDRFAVEFVGPLADPPSSVGLRLGGVQPLPDLRDACGPCWVVLLGQPGEVIDVTPSATRAALHWLRGLRLRRGGIELLCVCAGSVLAAHAGLLAGVDATTHHHHLDELQRIAPDCRVQRNRVFVESGAVWTSAGVTTGIDLTLHRVAETCGEAVAARVAEQLVVALRRGPADPELSPFLAHRAHLHAALHRVQNAVCQQPQRGWSVDEMARVACTSARHLTRLFAREAGVSPLQYLRRIRTDAAEAALRGGASVTRAAELAGFSSDLQLRRALHQLRADGTTPSALRRARGAVPTSMKDPGA